MRVTDSGWEVLIRFTRIASQADEPAAVLELLADAAAREIGADAAALVEVRAGGELTLAAGRNLPPELSSRPFEADAVDSALGQELVAASGGRFTSAITLPLMSDANLFGALVLLFKGGRGLDEETYALARALVDLAAVAVGRAFQYAELSRSYAELRTSREVLARTHKLRALGQMAAGVSHDLKNLLNPLSLHLQLLKRLVPKNSEGAHESITEMQQVVKRGVETIERLRDFSRQTPDSRLVRADLNELVTEAAKLCRPRLPARLVIRQELGKPPAVQVQSGECVGAIVNLVVNAIDALQTSGSAISLATGEAGGRAWVCVADDGPGMTPDVERRVFDPFFTTKGNEGTGLGLANVYAFVQRHAGTITLETAPGQGARFTLSFPPAPPED